MNDPTDPTSQPASSRGAHLPVQGSAPDILEFPEPATPPPGLMDRRLPFAVWLLIALLLGGLIAAGLFALSSG
ncbi:MAG: hypothetical protein WB680_01710 [Candidatus Acidiferrales bacterium]